jgi:hypothetical protein
MAEKADGCVKPAKGPITSSEAKSTPLNQPTPEVVRMGVQVGKPAPDFEASAFVPGEGFKNIKLSDYKGQWVVLCFYPGDFTFV